MVFAVFIICFCKIFAMKRNARYNGTENSKGEIIYSRVGVSLHFYCTIVSYNIVTYPEKVSIGIQICAYIHKLVLSTIPALDTECIYYILAHLFYLQIRILRVCIFDKLISPLTGKRKSSSIASKTILTGLISNPYESSRLRNSSMVMVLLLLIRYSCLPSSCSLRSVCAEPGTGLSRNQRTPKDTLQVSTIVCDSPYW